MEAFTDRTTKNSSEAAPAVSDPPSAVHRLVFHGSGGELFGIFVVNLLLTIFTLGIYSFWAKVRTRQYLWGQSEFAGDRFGFHGTGQELLIGWLKVALLLGGLVALMSLLQFGWGDPMADVLAQGIFYMGLLVLFPLARIGSMRYRLSRTSWRGIRFSFRGQYRPFLWLSLRGFLLTGLTAGLYYPFYQSDVRRYLTEHSHFGPVPFTFDGRGGDLFGSYALTYLLTLPTLGLIWVWYTARRRRYFWNHTLFAEARFHSTVTGGSLLGLYTVNLAIIVLSLGLALPWATIRTKRYDFEHLSLQGPLDLDHITQQAQTVSPVGEELAGFLDLDVLPG